ncbi:hypothetical protein SKAU_G00016460 [Synaphobranchus kaupii]|uniref:Uncharacterized protein n=1 Tax=Synaphobranchus kaupii TaxID=118154 RepID=A0A9Q1GC48_SYNKA|nr:hypothetical protein SKAU_G00016460 [Synaphobranchus kaupii]
MENVQVFDSPGKGRGLRAAKEMWAGDVVFAEPSFAAVVFDKGGECCHSHDSLSLLLSLPVQPSEELVKEVTEFSLDTIEKLEKARLDAKYHEVVKLCRECLKRQEPVLASTHLYMLRILSTLSEVLSYLQYFEEAAGYARRMVEGYIKLYHPNNAQMGMATMRAGVTHWHAGLIEIGHGMICKANAILLITHGPTHPITKDLEAMRMQTEMELRMFQQNEYMYYSMREAALKNQPMGMMAEPVAEGVKKLFRKQ